MTRIHHVLLTRFNLPSQGAESYVRAEEGWLRRRVALFERYCLPSVRSQTVPNLSWIIYLDPESPRWLKDRMSSLSSDGLFHPVYRAEVPRKALVSDIDHVVEDAGDVLITTNLDNDDGLASDFSARVQAVSVGARHVIYLDNGLILAQKMLFLRRDPRNAFCSVAEPWEQPVTCWSEWHNRLPATMPAVNVGGAPGWLQVVHGQNVSNRVRGRLVSPRLHVDSFPGLLVECAEPTASQIRLDRLVSGPLRAGRDSARAAAKSAVLAVGGRQSTDRLHERWNALRYRLRGGG